MWISRKEYNFLKTNAEKNIDAECEILRAQDRHNQQTARAMKAYSAALEELDNIKDRLKYYLEVGVEKGVVFIPKFVIEEIVDNM